MATSLKLEADPEDKNLVIQKLKSLGVDPAGL